MSINIIKKIKKLLLVLLTLLLFIGFQISKNRYGETATLLEAFMATLIGTGLFSIMGSDWMYYNQLIDKGAKINYYYFQLFSLFLIVIIIFIVSIATYKGL